ncbi:tetratricopeptide repeat protein [Haloferula sargassicola]|uniref:Beta-barrel assembly-enhancing protease n=1 Tax=Haloferula sargassicola TaxID=490096 RepID=A0ABP9USE4_9BACT
MNGRLLLILLSAPLMAGPREDFARGVLEAARGKDPIDWYQKALAADPEAWPLVRKVAGLETARGGIEAASTLYREFAARHPERLEAQLAYADFLGEVSPRDDFAAKLAGESLEKALVRFPGSIGVRRRLFRSYEQRGMRERSLAMFDEVEKSESPGMARFGLELARNLFEADDQQAQSRVDAMLDRAMASFPGNAGLAKAASEYFRTSGRLDRAVAVLEQHVAAAPSSLELRTRLGILLFAADRGEEGVRVLREVLEIDPRRWLAHQALAKYFRKVDRPEEARAHAAERLKLRGGDASEFAELAQEWLDADEPRNARLLLEKGVFDAPEDAELAALLAVATRRDPETASRAAGRFREAEALSGNDGPAAQPDFQLAFAGYLIESGKPELAEAKLRSAIKGYPPEAREETAAALRQLADLWDAQGKNEAAAKSLRRRAEALIPAESK